MILTPAKAFPLSIALTPRKRLALEGEGSPALGKLFGAFWAGSGAGLLFLAESPGATPEDPTISFWREFSSLYLTRLAATPEPERPGAEIGLPSEILERFLLSAPPMRGAEYLDEPALRALWQELGGALAARLRESGLGTEEYLSARHTGLHVLGRVCFHLAENKDSPEKPFAFLATYAHRLAEGKARHLPLRRALTEYAEANRQDELGKLLEPINRATLGSAFLRELVASGNIYETLAFTAEEAHRFLLEVPLFESAGIAVRVPDWWKQRLPARPQIAISLGDRAPAGLGLNAILDFSVSVTVGEEALSHRELEDLLSAGESLVFFRGRWVEVDHERLSSLLTQWDSLQGGVGDGIGLGEALRLLAGVDSAVEHQKADEATPLARVIAGEWLARALTGLRDPEAGREADTTLQRELRAELRPYQRRGVAWLKSLHRLQLGGILADDMGLGKTIQVISLLLLEKHRAGAKFRALLVLPASLLGNWQAELARFAPSLRAWVAHGSGEGYGPPNRDVDLVLTTYGALVRGAPWIAKNSWSLLIADEAQAIKNPAARQTRALKAVPATHRLALTGTPLENRLGDLWSLFDFVAPGLLGTPKAFTAFLKEAKNRHGGGYAALRSLVRPYILRRLKTDPAVIQDLPAKTEVLSYCSLSRAQVALYQQAVTALAEQIAELEGIQRRGLVLAALTRLKQICNHPSQLLKDGRYAEAASGKFLRLRELAEVIAEKQEKALVFTQFQEITEPLHDFLAGIFGRPGCVLSGKTAVKERSKLVEAFQREDGPPFFVLSLKAGGMGLNLTAASHVIHFDRWWNPAVEAQATDRAFRIGQRKNVLVHQFVCRGTLEEKIDSLLESKRALSREILEEGDGAILTELSDSELLRVVALDISTASAEPEGGAE